MVKEKPAHSGDDFERTVADIFRDGGWKVRRNVALGSFQADAIFSHVNGHRYIGEIKAAAEGRRDRLIPLLSQAILQAQTYARQWPEPLDPLAIVAARQISRSVLREIQAFAERYAPEIAIGVIDLNGLRAFRGPGLDSLNFEPSSRSRSLLPVGIYKADLFSDLNQWMLKVLLGQQLPASFISVPRTAIRNASHLAQVAEVSVMSASRLVRQLVDGGFLELRSEQLDVVRIPELLERWVSANRSVVEFPARLIIRKNEDQFLAIVARYAHKQLAAEAAPRCCLGLFAGANALGLGHVRGVPPHLYLDTPNIEALRKLGLSTEQADHQSDVLVRIPSARNSLFRAAVIQNELPVCDVLQLWLDTSAFPVRGREQAELIWRRVLKPAFGDR